MMWQMPLSNLHVENEGTGVDDIDIDVGSKLKEC
jgi:hypothetical protein